MLELVRQGVGGAIAALGLVIMLGGAIGMLRFPDFYTRLHAARAADSLGAVVTLIGLAVLASDLGVSLRLLLLAALVAAIGPTIAQLLANAAHAAGLAPLSGNYTAPRPNAKRGDVS